MRKALEHFIDLQQNQMRSHHCNLSILSCHFRLKHLHQHRQKSVISSQLRQRQAAQEVRCYQASPSSLPSRRVQTPVRDQYHQFTLLNLSICNGLMDDFIEAKQDEHCLKINQMHLILAVDSPMCTQLLASMPSAKLR